MEAVSKFVPYETLQLLGAESLSTVQMGTCSLKRLTVMFATLHGFDVISARLSPEEAFKFLNGWLDGVLPDFQRAGGIIDKLLGDCCLVFFHNAEKALKACQRIFTWADQRNAKGRMTGSEPLVCQPWPACPVPRVWGPGVERRVSREPPVRSPPPPHG